jgi:hypothetical protein
MWLYQRYKLCTPINDPLHSFHYTLPHPIMAFLHDTFSITHSYIFSPLTCSTSINSFFSPFPRDTIFGSLGTSFQYKWKGIGYVHPHTEKDLQHALHWARLASQHDPNTITILIIPNKNWYNNINPLQNLFPNTHILAHF